MNMVVDVLASNDWCDGMSFLCASIGTGVLKLETFLLKTSLDRFRIAVLVLTMFDRYNVVLMLLWEDFTIFDWLYRSVIMVLMNFTVDGCSSFFVTVFGDLLIHYGGGNFLVNRCVMVTSLVPVESMVG